MKVNFLRARKILLSAVLLVAVFTSGYFLGVKGYNIEVNRALKVTINRRLPNDKNVDMSLFWQVWDLVSDKYYDKSKLIPSQMVYGAIRGMVASVGDPYTAFLEPNLNKVVNEDLNGSFGGVGIEIGYRNGQLSVIAPLSGTPAEKAGVKAGDYIVKITDKLKNIDIDTLSMTTSEAVTHIRGEVGTKVILTLARDGTSELIVMEIIRQTINVPSVTLSWVGEASDIANIKVSKFGLETKTEWDKAVSEIQKKGNVKGIIVDLRNNPGGYLQGSIDLASDFLPVGTVVVIQESGRGFKDEYKSGYLPRLENYKTVILINEGSASASEIFSGALRDVKSVKLVGGKSFGKGTIQEPVDMEGGSGVHITTAKWLTPKGIWIHEKGLVPDIEIPNSDNTAEDEQLEAAIKLF